MKPLRVLALLSAILLFVGCSDDSPDAQLTGVFVDSTVSGLGYECGDDDTRHFTNADGEFTCTVGDEVRFYLGELQLGSVVATPGLEVVTPAMLTGASVNELVQLAYGDMGMPGDELLSGVYMAMVLQAFDLDGDPDNGIVIPDDVHDLFAEAGLWDFEDESPESAIGQIFDALETLEIVVPDPEEAFLHMLAENEKLLHGHYQGTVQEEQEEDTDVDLFVFHGPGDGEETGPGLQMELMLSFFPYPEPFTIDVGEPLVEFEDVLLAVDLSLDGITIRVYDLEAIMQAEIPPPFDEQGNLDLAVLAPFLMHTVPLSKVTSPPDVELVDVLGFLATLPNGEPVPVDLDEMPAPELVIFAETPSEEMPMVPAPPTATAQGGMVMYGDNAKKLYIEGGFSVPAEFSGHVMLASLGDTTAVYRGRLLIWYLDFGTGQEPEEHETWADVTATVHADGSLDLSIEGDDGFSLSETLEVGFAGVDSPEF